MKNLEREPVWKLKEYIWTYFLSSCKRHLFITGSRQTGKTSIINALLVPDLDYGGIVTRAIRRGSSKPDFVVLEDIHDKSAHSIIGCWNESSNSMVPCLDGFEKYGVGILSRYLEGDLGWIIIDEIGFLENNAYAFQQKIRSCLQHKRVIAALSKRCTSFLEELYACPNALILDLDYYNLHF